MESAFLEGPISKKPTETIVPSFEPAVKTDPIPADLADARGFLLKRGRWPSDDDRGGGVMQSLAGAAIASLIIVSTVVAIRLLLLHRRSGATPELLLGAMLFLSVSVGYPFMIASDQVGAAWSGMLFAVATIAINAGFCLLYAFTWRVFQPQAPWARAFACAGMVVLFANALHQCIQVAQGAFAFTQQPLSESLFQTTPVLVAYLWASWEALRYHAMLQRRMKLGLADAVVTDRVLLWGLLGVPTSVGILANSAAIALHLEVFSDPRILLLSSFTGMSQAVILVLAFVPPRAYLDWVRARTAASGA